MSAKKVVPKICDSAEEAFWLGRRLGDFVGVVEHGDEGKL